MTDVARNYIVFSRPADKPYDPLETMTTTATNPNDAVHNVAGWRTEDAHLRLWWAIPLYDWNQVRRNVRRSINLEVV